MLKVEGLNAGYGSVNILWDIGFEVKDGEIVAILGSNGAGKTTMVRTFWMRVTSLVPRVMSEDAENWLNSASEKATTRANRRRRT